MTHRVVRPLSPFSSPAGVTSPRGAACACPRDTRSAALTAAGEQLSVRRRRYAFSVNTQAPLRIVAFSDPERSPTLDPASRRTTEVALINSDPLRNLSLSLCAVEQVERLNLLVAGSHDFADPFFRHRRATDDMDQALEQLLKTWGAPCPRQTLT